jgi:hypothetical protein
MNENKVLHAIDMLMAAFDKPPLSESLIAVMAQIPDSKIREDFVKRLSDSLEKGMAISLQSMYDALDVIKKDPADYAQKIASVMEGKDGSKT